MVGYIGKDLTNTLNYFAVPTAKSLKQILSGQKGEILLSGSNLIWESDSAADREVSDKEVELIRAYQANYPKAGCNR